MNILGQILAAVALLASAVIYGTDVFCAIVQRPALAQVSDAALTSVMGRVHEYGDRRMPLPGVIGVIAAALAAITAGIAGHAVAAAAAAVAVAAQVVWLVIYLRISAPVNRALTAAASAGEVPADARSLQRRWDSVITARAVLQGAAAIALCVAIAVR
jgi:cellulase/cellobiase CelA1